MTLVVSVMTDTSAYMISDAILSVKTGENSADVECSYPTKSDAPVTGIRTVAGLSQKIVSIGNGLFVGWAGDYDTARRFIEFLRIALKNCNLSREAILSAQKDYFKLHHEDEERICTMIAFDTGDAFFLTPQGMIHAMDVPAVGKIYAMGSGAQEFLDYIDSHPPERFASKFGQPLDVDMIQYFISYISNTVNAQTSTGVGIEKGWGGWFEILLKKGGTLEKLDSIMYASMYLGSDDGKIQTSQIGRRYVQYYEGERLLILSQGKGEALRLNVISPPDQKNPSTVQVRACYPQLLCLNFIHPETKEGKVTLLYNAYGHDYCGVGESIDGKELAIRLNTRWLAEIISKLEVFSAASKQPPTVPDAS